MYCLNLETSTRHLSLALSQDGKVLRYRHKLAVEFLEKTLVGYIDQMINKAGITLTDIKALAISLGPGSFTSLRVGLATVKALAHAGGHQVVGVSTLEVIAQGVVGSYCDNIVVLTDARRGMVYGASFDPAGQRLSPDQLLTMDKALAMIKGKALVVGDAIAICRDMIKDANAPTIFAHEHLWFPQAKLMVPIAYQRIKQGLFDDAKTLQPLYLYPDDCQTVGLKAQHGR